MRVQEFLFDLQFTVLAGYPQYPTPVGQSSSLWNPVQKCWMSVIGFFMVPWIYCTIPLGPYIPYFTGNVKSFGRVFHLLTIPDLRKRDMFAYLTPPRGPMIFLHPST